MLQEPQQRLPYATQFGDLVDGQPDRRLDAAIGILLEPVADLHEADRRRNDECAPSRLLVARREGPLTEQIELVLVEAALEAEQQAVVALPRRIDRLLVDQERVDDPAHLDELLPVAAVAREARDLPCRHRSNLAQAHLGDHALEARPGRPAELREAIAHGVLQGLALAVVPRTGPPAVPWRIDSSTHFLQEICYCKSLKYHAERV